MLEVGYMQGGYSMLEEECIQGEYSTIQEVECM